jgi:hypothetical protein
MATLKDLDKKLDRLSKDLTKLNTKVASAGWNNSLHPTATIDGSPISFAFLAYIHEHGSNSTKYPTPARKLLQTVAMQMDLKDSKEIQRIVLTNLLKYGTIDESKLLPALANFVKDKIQNVMGDPSLLLPNADLTADNKGGNTPLVDSGALRANVITKIGE